MISTVSELLSKQNVISLIKDLSPEGIGDDFSALGNIILKLPSYDLRTTNLAFL